MAVPLAVIRSPFRAVLTRTAVSLIASLLVLTYLSDTARGDTTPQARARYGSRESHTSLAEQQTVHVTPLHLSDGSKLTVISPTQWSDISEDLLVELRETHLQHTARLGKIPAVTASVRLMDEAAFFDYTGAPSWTNAIFYRGQILIPLSKTQPIDLENLRRSVKHEYTHAVIAALSGGKAPGWLDEGLAQWAEGNENPALRAALKSYLKSNEPVPMRLLQGGFTRLNESMVPAAYAQSLLATKALLEYYGFDLITAYLGMLRAGTDKSVAFETAFRVSPDKFEDKLSLALKKWAALKDEEQAGT